MEVGIKGRLAKKEYDSITSDKVFAETLTEHLYQICKDHHVYVRFANNQNPIFQPSEMTKEGNFGFNN